MKYPKITKVPEKIKTKLREYGINSSSDIEKHTDVFYLIKDSSLSWSAFSIFNPFNERGQYLISWKGSKFFNFLEKLEKQNKNILIIKNLKTDKKIDIIYY